MRKVTALSGGSPLLFKVQRMTSTRIIAASQVECDVFLQAVNLHNEQLGWIIELFFAQLPTCMNCLWI